MKIKLIQIDTNGENASKFTQNVELYDLITPNIVFLVDSCNSVFMADEFDWGITRRYFHSDSNGHCIYDKRGLYTAAYEFSRIGVKVKEGCDAGTLSELCNELAEEFNIRSWRSNYQISK